MKISRLFLLASVMACAIAEIASAFEPGERVVIINSDHGIQTSNGGASYVELGACYEVLAEEDGYVYVEGNLSGWVLAEDIIELDDALEHFRRLSKEDPDNVEYFAGRIQVYCELEDHRTALKELNAALEDSEDGWLYSYRGNVYRHMGRADKAILDYTKALELQGEYPNLHRSMGHSYMQLDNYEKALESFSAAIRLDGIDTGDFLLRAKIYEELGNEAASLEDLVEAATIDSSNSTIQNNLAWMLATSHSQEIRDGQRAVRHGRLACELTQFRDPSCLDTLAAACAEAGDFERAIICEEKVLESLPESVDTTRFEERLELYRQGQPYREPAGEGHPAEEAESNTARGEY